MRLSVLMGFGLLLATTSSYAAEAPTGEWLVENGHGHVRIENCGGALWGVVSWEEKPGGRDNENPDPALRGRPTLGMPILIDMKPAVVQSWNGKSEERWKGEVYSPENGKMYSSSIWLTGPDKMRIEGCVFGGIFCGGQDWTRVPGTQASALPAPASKAAKATPKAQPKGKASAKAATTTGSGTIDVCSRVADFAGRTH